MKEKNNEKKLLKEWLRLEGIRTELNDEINDLNVRIRKLTNELNKNVKKHALYISEMNTIKKDSKTARYELLDTTLSYLAAFDDEENDYLFEQMEVAKRNNHKLNSDRIRTEILYDNNFLRNGDIDNLMSKYEKNIFIIKGLMVLLDIKQGLIKRKLVSIYGNQAFDSIINEDNNSNQKNKGKK